MNLILVASLLAIVASQSAEESLCSKWGGMYESICPSQGQRTGFAAHQGVPGKRGPVGEKGERGLKGSEGTKGSNGQVNYYRVGQMISQRLVQGHCPVTWNGKCFWIAARFDPKITFDEGKQICADLGGNPANIYSEEHYNMMMEYLRTFAIKDNWAEAWSGMTFNSLARTTLLSSGLQAPFSNWFPGRPGSDCCNIYLRAEMDWRSARQHMLTGSATWGIRGVICEI